MADNNENEVLESTVEETIEAVSEPEVKTPEVKETETKVDDSAVKAAAAAAAATAAAEEQKAAKAAAEEQKAAEAAAKAAEKARAKAEKQAKKAAAKAEKKRIKREKNQAIIDSCPPEYRAMSTSKYFWVGFLCSITCVGFIVTILLSIIPRNKNLKHFARAILIGYIVSAVITVIVCVLAYFFMDPGPRDQILSGVETIMSSIGF